jgi:beta-catenin-like protein 1
MTSVDELFRKPSSSSISTSNKRKFPESAIPSASTSNHKSAKFTANGTPHTPTAEDDLANDDDDIAAGPSLPSPDDPDAEGEDEEGRFFGSGVSADTRNALDYVEGLDAAGVEGGGAEEEEVIDAAWLRRTAVRFEKGINRNAELRGRFEGMPEKYV